MTRPTWDEYFLGIAEAVARRADCTRAQVGAVIVRDNRIVAVGYNGAPAGDPGCATDGACPRGRAGYDAVPHDAEYAGPGTCIAVHAEANALLYADRASCVGATIYVTHQPCDGCATLIRAGGVSHVVHAPSGAVPGTTRSGAPIIRHELYAIVAVDYGPILTKQVLAPGTQVKDAAIDAGEQVNLWLAGHPDDVVRLHLYDGDSGECLKTGIVFGPDSPHRP